MGPGAPTYKRSRRGNALIDRAVAHVLCHFTASHKIIDFIPYGYDERQYCSPGFNLPVGLFQRSQFGTFAEYHTSADNLDFIRPQYFGRVVDLIIKVLDIIEGDRKLTNLYPKGEPQLGRRGLYATGTGKHSWSENMAVLWILQINPTASVLLDIAERANMPFGVIAEEASRLERHGMLAATDEPSAQ